MKHISPKETLSSYMLLVFSLVHLSQQNEDVPFKVKIVKSEGGSPIGSVHGAKQCGGPGEFVQLRIEGCKPSSPCKLRADGGILHAEMDFIPVIDMAQMRFKVTSTPLGGRAIVRFDSPVENSAVVKGVEHTVHVTGAGRRDYQGKTVKGVYELFNVADDSLRVCMDVEVEWI